jgi:CheY-like chemotaxis protein
MKKIILADDKRTFLMYAGLLLKRFDFKIMPAEGGAEVLKLMKLIEPDVVLLDVHMQDLDGISVLRYIKDDKQTAHIPIIMISADSSAKTIEECRNQGCFDYLTKPLKVEKLHDTLQRCFFSHKGTNRKFLRAPYNEKITVVCKKLDLDQELYGESLSVGESILGRKRLFLLIQKLM